MPRIVLVIEYDGANYVGWQVQPNGVAVQQVIGGALFELTGERIDLHASGRTDSGVHARAQVAHFDTESRIPPDKFAFALNTRLPADIRIKGSFSLQGEGENEFHSRFSVKKKHYRYAVLNTVHASAFYAGRALHIYNKLDIEKLNAAAARFIGTHDFAAFKAAGSKVATTVRTVYSSEWRREGDLICYYVSGSGFLYNMVRIMVGTMLRVGLGYDDASIIDAALNDPRRTNAGDTAPAHALTLWRVEYDEFDTDEVLQENALL
ncbi:MAG: tRNA pseudouridine(38-40) synthase TruA [Clostridia bacterium]|nr:tRNA pseudouridine(38-40) synthase TruA [Clostridia bacterium]